MKDYIYPSLAEVKRYEGDYHSVPVSRTILSDSRTPVEVLRALKAAGYDGIVSVEIFDPAVQAMKAEECIPLAFRRTAAALKEAENSHIV